MIMASKGCTAAQPAVIATSPARMPLQKPPTSKALGATTFARKRNTINPAAQGARVVLHATRPALLASPTLLIDNVLPGLKPYQPNQRKKVPRTQKGTLWAAKSFSWFGSQRSLRSPTTSAP